MLESVGEADLRTYCRGRIETLERWLRRLIHDQFKVVSNDYLHWTDRGGAFLINSELRKRILARYDADPSSFHREIDAATLEDTKRIVCNPKLFHEHFRDAFELNFPDTPDQLRRNLEKIIGSRNALSHSNPISTRDAEKVICYTGDIIDSVKDFYSRRGMDQEYNIPKIIKVLDYFGNSLFREQMSHNDGGVLCYFNNDNRSYLRPGDTLSIEIDVDNSFPRDEYQLSWSSANVDMRHFGNENRISISISEDWVSENRLIACNVTTNRKWHRLGTRDDFIILIYRILPPLT